jgi:hypothetical protein
MTDWELQVSSKAQERTSTHAESHYRGTTCTPPTPTSNRNVLGHGSSRCYTVLLYFQPDPDKRDEDLGRAQRRKSVPLLIAPQ